MPLVGTGTGAASSVLFSLNLPRILGGKQVCATANDFVQFLSEDKLLITAGPGPSCYRAVNDVELVVITTAGKVIAKKPWASTVPPIVLSPGRIAIHDDQQIFVLDDQLKTVQSIPLPEMNRVRQTIHLVRQGPDDILVSNQEGDAFDYYGTPLHRALFKPLIPDKPRLFVFPDGQFLTEISHNLVKIDAGGKSKVFASLAWVVPCEKFCQLYEAYQSHSVSESGKKRILIASNGSRFPITDAAGLFPYYRIQVFDLETGKEILRKEFLTKTGQRASQLSPMGDLLLLSDGTHIEIERLE
jgi:hypothetical protein